MSEAPSSVRVLVTGHAGYIGSVLTPLLARSGHDVTGIDTQWFRGCDFGSPREWPNARVGDVRDLSPADLEDFDAIVHLAGIANDPLGDLHPELTLDINLEGTLSLARAAKAAGVRTFVFASSCSMYGAASTDDLLDEDAPLRPLTPYAESKVRAEEGLFDLVDDDFSVVSMRNATVYGLSPRLRIDIVLNNLAAWAVTTGRIRLLSDGVSWRPLVHVEDLARAADALLRAPRSLVSGQAFNIGTNDQNYVIRELAELLADATGCEVAYANEPANDPRSYRVDFSKLASAFPSLVFEWDAAAGGRELVDGYRRVGLTREVFESRRYVRLEQVRHLLEAHALDPSLRWADRVASPVGS
jgi:nucleoside-diphosphate-sugar epimerase